MTQSDKRPVVACYCATFLKPEMLHIYRQITSLRRWRPIVIAQKREEPNRFPFDPVTLVPKPPLAHFARRLWFRQLRDAPWQISSGERDKLLSILKTENAQLLHIYFGHIAVHLLPLIRAKQAPTVVSFHGADVMVDLEKPAYRSSTIAMLRLARLVLVRSASLGQVLTNLGCPGDKLRINRTGIPSQEFPFVTRTWPATGEWHLLQAGRLIEKKGIDTSLRAFAAFHQAYPRSMFTIAGEGPLLAELQQLSRDLGVAEHVNFTGFLSAKELRDLYYAAHLFVHPSRVGKDGNQEGVPNSMLEAMATGLPVFSTTHGGIPEAVENGVSGVLVPESDHTSLAEELITFASHPERLGRFAHAGRAGVEQKFDQQKQVAQLEDYYFEALAR